MGFRDGYQGVRGETPGSRVQKMIEDHNQIIDAYNRGVDRSNRQILRVSGVVIAGIAVLAGAGWVDYNLQSAASSFGVTKEVQDATSALFAAALDDNVEAFKIALANPKVDTRCLNRKGENILDVAARSYSVGSMQESVLENIINNPEIMKNVNPRNRNLYGNTPLEQIKQAIEAHEGNRKNAEPTSKDYDIAKKLEELEKNNTSRDIHFLDAAKDMAQSNSK